MGALARDKHPLSWRDLMARELERGAAGAWSGHDGQLTREAVLALTLRVQEWLVTSPAEMQGAAAKRALTALHRVVRRTDGMRNEVLRVLSSAVMEDQEDRIRFARLNLRRLLGSRTTDVTDAMLGAALDGWLPASSGEAPRPKWKPVLAILHALGFTEVTDSTVARVWRASTRKKATPEG
jgi:hypothetical protein